MTVNIPAPPPNALSRPDCEADVRDYKHCGFDADTTSATPSPMDIGAAETLQALGNGDEQDYRDKSASYSKGLRQNGPGRVHPETFLKFRRALNAVGDMGRQGALLGAYDGAPLKGPSGAQASAMIGADPLSHRTPAPPNVASREYAAELIELYWASLLRDTPFATYEADVLAIAAVKELDRLGEGYRGPRDADGKVTAQTLFRGGLRKGGKTYFAGESWGPYVSQFLLHPTRMGAQPLDQKFQSYRPGVDYLSDEKDWEWIQKGGSPSRRTQSDPVRRHLRDGRGLSAYAHADEAIQAYLVAHLIMQNAGLRGNADSPYLGNQNETPFATFGAPDIVGTLGAVARAALIAVGYQKWHIHLRHRPESGGGLAHLAKTQRDEGMLQRQTGERDRLHEAALESVALKLSHVRNGSYLLAQAYPEGAPLEPSYPSGHGAVAGACIAALKFFYDCERPIVSYLPVLSPSNDGLYLCHYDGIEAAQMTFNSELGKLGHNVSFGSGLHAGGNWRSDTDAGMLLGEEVAIAFLKDQAGAYRERFAIKIRKFDGEFETIGNKD
jgi:hypothetical protein